MAYVTLLVEVQDGIARITLNRPHALNALDRAMIADLAAALAVCRIDEGIGVVILTGAGDRAFSAGADIRELHALTAQTGRDYAAGGQAVLDALEELGKPTVAAVNGAALGGGCELALACSLRVAATTARFGQPEVSLGLIPGYGGTQRLPRLVGMGRALELILTGATISADEAYRIGLVNRVVPREQLAATCDEMARTILSKGPRAVRLALDAVQRGVQMGLREGLAYEATAFGLITGTTDMKEGTAAFLEKRAPRFTGA